MKRSARFLAASFFCAIPALPHMAAAQAPAIPPILVTPDTVETRIGTLEFKDGAPSVETAEKVYDTLDFTRGLDVFLNSYGGASAYAIRQGSSRHRRRGQYGHHLPRTDGCEVAVPHGQRRHRLLLQHRGSDEGPDGGRTAAEGAWHDQRHVVRSGSSTLAFPAPTAAKAENTSSCRRAMTARFRTAAFTCAVEDDAGASTLRALFSRTTIRSRPSRTSRKRSRFIPTRRAALARASRQRSKARSGSKPTRPVPATKFVEASGKSYNTIPPSDYSFFEMINANVQQEPADSYNPELAGQLAAIGIVKGKPFNPDARMKKILTDAAAVGNAAGRVLNWRSSDIPDWAYYPDSCWANMLWQGGANFETPPPMITKEGYLQTAAADRRANSRFENGVLLRLHPRLPGHDHAASARRLAVSDGLPGRGQERPSTAARRTR